MNPSTSQEALGQLQTQQAGAKSAADILANQRAQAGIQGAEDTVKGLRGAITNTTRLLNNVAPSVMGRTAGSLVTSAQANRQVANEQQPIAQQLGEQTQGYATAQSDLDRASGRAAEAANLEYGEQQNKMSYLQNLYNTLFSREQSAQQAAERERDRQESVRQFNEQLAQSKRSAAASGAGSYNLGGLLGGGNAGSSQWVNNGADNQFKDASGRGITAFQFAQQKGIGYRELLSQMAAKGDKNAEVALKYVGDNGIFGSAPRAVASALSAVGARGNLV